jgi:circadian clock protein KaiC
MRSAQASISHWLWAGPLTLLVLGQHGIIGDVEADIDPSYLSDGILLFRSFEAKAEIRTAVSVAKSRVVRVTIN